MLPPSAQADSVDSKETILRFKVLRSNSDEYALGGTSWYRANVTAVDWLIARGDVTPSACSVTTKEWVTNASMQ